MKRVLVLATLLGLSGCAWLETNYAEEVERVKEYAVKICNFLPTDASVRAMLAATDPAVRTAIEIANAICEQVTRMTNPPSTLLMNPYSLEPCPQGEVNGVCIEGDFVPPEKDE